MTKTTEFRWNSSRIIIRGRLRESLGVIFGVIWIVMMIIRCDSVLYNRVVTDSFDRVVVIILGS